jgi:nitroreductase/dihydropteridine reductase
MNDILASARARYSAKVFDPTRKIPAPQIEQLRELLRLSPSSINLQPWHFVVASTEAGKARVAKATQDSHGYNTPKILNASHVFVLCTRHTLTDAHLDAIVEQEARDGRFANPQIRQTWRNDVIFSYGDLHRYTLRDASAWMEKQTYIALGTLLRGAAELKLDAAPLEGFDSATLDRELGLREQGFVSNVLVCLGYHGESDFNVKLNKSRFPAEALFTDI